MPIAADNDTLSSPAGAHRCSRRVFRLSLFVKNGMRAAFLCIPVLLTSFAATALLFLTFTFTSPCARAGYESQTELRYDERGNVYLTAKDLESAADWKSFMIGARYPHVWRWLQDDKHYYALPSFDDSDWKYIRQRTDMAALNVDWSRVMWFRAHIYIDSALRYSSIALMPYQFGAAEYYVNGRLITALGNPSQDPKKESVITSKGKPVVLQFGEETHYVLAVRYSFTQFPIGVAFVPSIANGVPISMRFAPLDKAITMQRKKESYFSVRYLVAVGMTFGLALLHIALFAYYPQQKFHILYAFFTLLVSLRFLTVFIQRLAETHPGVDLFFQKIPDVYNNAIPLACWLFFYSLFYKRPQMARLWIGGVATVAIIVARFIFHNGLTYHLSVALIALLSADTVRIAFLAMRRREPGAVILLVGILDFSVMWTFRWVESFHILPFAISPNAMETFVYAGYMAVPLAMSLYIALSVARAQYALQERIVEVQTLSKRALEQERQAKELEIRRMLLEADNARKTQELEEARALQLSMLPSALPEHPCYEVAAYMRTATEVGGDYYDFRASPENDALALAVGDATGHGMKAGYLVSTTKSYFQTLAMSESGASFLAKLSHGIKNMNLRGMYMCLALARCAGRDLHIAIAGMPPVLIYRARAKSVERLCVKALPLGSVAHFEYREIATTLDEGDVALIMTDGLPELFNAEDDMLDYERIERRFAENAHKSAAEIIASLQNYAEEWMNGATLRDDMTFVALKMKKRPHNEASAPSWRYGASAELLPATLHTSILRSEIVEYAPARIESIATSAPEIVAHEISEIETPKKKV
jgi:serine phosphatase RsbU (regulator of sigma subunit)